MQLAEGLDVTPVIPEENHLVEPLHISAVPDVVHADFNARPASPGRGCIDVAGHCSRVEVQRIGPEKLHESHRLSDRPENLRVGVIPQRDASAVRSKAA